MINEMFDGIQGEGKTQGQYRTFIRFNTCNLHCSFCDSSYTFGKGDQQINLPEEIYSHIVLTGGEPLLSKNWNYFKENIFHKYSLQWIEVETNGTIIPDGKMNLIDLWNISPKDPKYQVNSNINSDPILLSMKDSLNDYIVKFIIKEESDLEFVNQIKEKYLIPNNRIWLMPYTEKNGTSNSNLIYDLAFTNKYNFSARLHVLIKGNLRGI